MANTIFISDEYAWTASSGLFEWVLEYLMKSVDDAATKETIQQVVQHGLGSVDVTQMSEAGRREVLSALRTGMVAAAEASPELIQHQPARRLTIGHIKVLKLMADDVARTENA
jgi:hypothetical protein